MTFSSLPRLLGFALSAALLVLSPAASAQIGAPDQPAPGPPLAEELLYDTSLEHSCPQWVYDGDVTDTGNSMEIYDTGYLKQTVYDTSTYSTFTLYVAVNVIGSSGTGRLRIEILNASGSIVETVDTIWPSDSDGWREYPIDNYSNQDFTVRFRYISGINPAAVYEVTDAVLWAAY